MHNPWLFTAVMGVIAISMVVGVYLSSVGANNRSTAAPNNSADIVDQTQATASATAAPTATATPGPVRSYAAAPAMSIDPNKQYTATIKTDKGTITIQLFAKDAPKTVNNFVFLAEHHFYDGLTFDRVVPGFVIQAGDPTGDGTGGPGYSIPFEANNQKNVAGAVGMATTAPKSNTGGSQFYIDLSAQPSLDGQYAVFGQVTSGMNVVQAIGQTAHDPGSPGATTTIESITISSS